MSKLFDLSTVAKRFRFVAVAEAITWLLLLIGMAIKWIPDPNIDSAVRVPGMLHGVVFVAYVVVTLMTARALKWSVPVTLIGLVASLPPFGTIIFERWVAKKGLLAELSVNGPSNASPGTGPGHIADDKIEA